jgi:hypothetical protein
MVAFLHTKKEKNKEKTKKQDSAGHLLTELTQQ